MIAWFVITNMGLISYFFGIRVQQINSRIFILQKKYAGNILKKFKIDLCKPILTPIEKTLELVKDGNGDLVDATT